ncbi:MAG: tocopherol cyclase family protein [Bacteroidota bacterium]
MRYFTRVWHPERYQGHGRKQRYFEGWYYKLVVPDQELAYAFIPGISMDENGEQHAFIQVLDGVKAQSAYHRFPADQFRAAKDKLAVWIGDCYFGNQKMEINLPHLKVKADFIEAKPWPKQLLSPGVMGWYGYIPGMQCYHGLVSLHHELRGQLSRGDKHYDLAGGIGYIEKDWGSSFPKAWVWMQSNHLEHPSPTSLMVSVADIPWLGTSFTGFLSTFFFDGELHTLATWTGAKVDLSIEPARVTVRLRDRHRELTVSGTPAPGGDLLSPLAGAMTGKINESLQAILDVQFNLDGIVRYQGKAHWAGLEVTDNAASMTS